MTDYVRVCAIDAGTRNFAYCVVDNFTWNAPLRWKKEDLWAPEPGRRRKPTKEDILYLTYAWVDRNKSWLDHCDVIVLENQMRTPFIIMNTVIHTAFFNKTISVSPMTIAAYFKLPKTREAKKPAAVNVAKSYCVMDEKVVKPDDLADAWLMAVWGLIQKGGVSSKILNQTKKLD